MKDLLLLLALLLTTLAKPPGPGEAEAIIADSLLMKQQLLTCVYPLGSDTQHLQTTLNKFR